jgi:6-phosphogluconate dehydrogenase (decarboxylating)
MTKLTINIGTAANDGTGDTLRNAFDKTNQNFTELYDTTVTLAESIDAVSNAILEESDPIFLASPAYDLTDLMISHINDAYNWGDHDAAGYAMAASTITITDLKILVAASTDFADFQSRIAAL